MNLNIFNTANLFEAATHLFHQLGIRLNSNTAEPLPTKDILKHHYKENDTFKAIDKTFFIGIIDDSVFKAMGLFDEDYSYKAAIEQGDKNYNGLMLFALELNKQPTRTEISDLTRTFNRISQKMPVALVLKYTDEKEAIISIAISERFKYLQNWRQGEKAGKVIILRDIHTQNTHAGHLRILRDLAKPVGVITYMQLHQHWLQVLDVNILNKKFFQDLANWYFWAMDNVSFPDDLEKKKDVRNATNLIRLITRVVFIWFIKEKSLVPNALFSKAYLDRILKDFNKNKKSHNYYNAILQNLFFGTLNQKMDERDFITEKKFQGKNPQYNVTTLYRYPELFVISKEEVIALFKDVPFLNGGLFDCLDKPKEQNDKEVDRVDGFTSNLESRAIIPDEIFFGEEREVDLNDIYATKNRKYKSRGLINLLESYKFTVAENTPIEEEIALDPELLGKVFENLLASYNPETRTTARKQTGSFYTPREIVNYMVDESLLEYLKQNVNPNSYAGESDDFETRLRELISYSETSNPFDEKETKALIEAINNCKILDPACGSGAYPMGILHKMVHLLQKLDPENKYWKALQRQKAIQETETAFNIGDKEERGERLAEINDVFENNASDYGRKLYLIENCIYGIDIQPIAVQISKLRFFISLIIDQSKQETKEKENLGIRSLPNLETKFVAANTLIDLDIPTNDLFSDNNPIKKLESDLKNVRHEYFAAFNRKDKLRLQKEDKRLRKQISELIKDQLIKKSDEDVILLKQMIEVENEKLKQLEKSNQDIEIIKITDLFGEITQTKIDKKAIKIKAQKDRISHFKKELQLKEQVAYKDSISKVAKQIASFDPYDQNAFAPWFNPEWMFGITNGFDIVIGNPPYGILNKKQNKAESILVSEEDLNFYKSTDFYKPAVGGMLNIFRLFILKSIRLLNSGGIFSEIFPLAFIGDLSINNLRKYILENCQILSIEAFPERDNPNKRVFEAVKMSVCILNLKNVKSTELFFIRINDDRFVNPFMPKSYLDYEIVKTLDKELLTFPLTSPKETEILVKLFKAGKRFGQIGKCNTGEIDMTFCKDAFSDNNNDAILLKGAIIDRYLLRTKMSQGEIVFIDEKKLASIKNISPELKKKSRIVLQGITGVNEKNRLKMMIIKEAYCANSLNYLTINDSINKFFLLGVLNSKLINFIFSKFSTNSNVNGYEVDNLPIVLPSLNIQKWINIIVQYVLFLKDDSQDTTFFERLIDAMVYELYLPEEIKAGGAEVLKHLSNLPELEVGQDEGLPAVKARNLKTIEKVYKELSDPMHPIGAALLKLLTIEEVNIIEGRK